MKILVTVKEVVEVDDDFEIVDDAVDERFLGYALNEWDDYAIEEAVQAREDGIADEVVAVTIGPERSEETIRIALAKGADRAVRVWDDTLAETRFTDVETRADVLGAVVEAEDPDLVLSGVQAGDDAFGATGVSLAETVEYEWAAVVNQLELDDNGRQASVHRELEGGLEELTDVALPAVLSIQTGINDPRYASLRGIRQAQGKELAVHTLADLGLDPSTLDDGLTLTGLSRPETDSDATVFEGEAGETADELATALRDVGVGAE